MWNKWSLRARGGGMSLTYAIVDLHGRFDLLTAAFDAIVKHAAERSFKIITLGDYVDRGPQSRQIIDHLMAAQEMGVSLICLKGIQSVRHQCRFGHRGKHTTCRPAKNKFPQPGMPVSAHDNEIGICIGCI